MGRLSPAEIAAMAEDSAPPSTEAGGVVQSCPKIRIHIGVFFDGTWNNEANAVEGARLRELGEDPGGFLRNSRAISLTHPSALRNHYPTFDALSAPDEEGIHNLFARTYISGVGTRDGYRDGLFSGITGNGFRSIESKLAVAKGNVEAAIARLSRACPSVEIVLDLFGFSRGAATARIFANRIREGIIPGARVRHMGLFDTVGAFGLAQWEWDDFQYNFNTNIGPDTADTVVHLTAHHEIRENFVLSSILEEGGRSSATRTEIALPGVHGTLGGSPLDTPERITVSYSDFPLMRAQGVFLPDRSPAQMEALRQEFSMRRRYESDLFDGRNINPGTEYAPIDPQVERTILPGLRILSLEVMHELTVRAGVPLDPLVSPFPLPAQFEGLKTTALAGGPLSQSQINSALGHISPSAFAWDIGNHSEEGYARAVIPNQPGDAE